jgi:[CysO sulfur-carrier protein]-S-L-cysteine hydrolase
VVDEKDWQEAVQAGSGPYIRATAKLHATLPAKLLQEIIDHSRAGLPNEACGLLVAPGYAADGGVPSRFMPLRNAAESPYRYMLADEDLLKVVEIEDAGEVVWGIVHSHVASPAEPSATDIGLARYPDSLYLICSLANPAPEVRAWSISDYTVLEVPLGVS